MFSDDVDLCLSFLDIVRLFDFADVVQDSIYSEWVWMVTVFCLISYVLLI